MAKRYAHNRHSLYVRLSLLFARFILSRMSSSDTLSGSVRGFTITTTKEIAKATFFAAFLSLLFEERARGDFCLHSVENGIFLWDLNWCRSGNGFHHLAESSSPSVDNCRSTQTWRFLRALFTRSYWTSLHDSLFHWNRRWFRGINARLRAATKRFRFSRESRASISPSPHKFSILYSTQKCWSGDLSMLCNSVKLDRLLVFEVSVHDKQFNVSWLSCGLCFGANELVDKKFFWWSDGWCFEWSGDGNRCRWYSSNNTSTMPGFKAILKVVRKTFIIIEAGGPPLKRTKQIRRYWSQSVEVFFAMKSLFKCFLSNGCFKLTFDCDYIEWCLVAGHKQVLIVIYFKSLNNRAIARYQKWLIWGLSAVQAYRIKPSDKMTSDLQRGMLLTTTELMRLMQIDSTPTRWCQICENISNHNTKEREQVWRLKMCRAR